MTKQMRRGLHIIAITALVSLLPVQRLAPFPTTGQAAAEAVQQDAAAKSVADSTVEKGSLTLHLLLHAIGEETYEIARTAPDNSLAMKAFFEYSDRGRKRTLSAMLQLRADLTPQSFDLENKTANSHDSTVVHGGTATVREGEV